MPTLTKLTYADYAAMPEGPPYYQLIEGELIMSPAPNRRHADFVERLGSTLSVFVRQHKLGRVYWAPFDVILSDDDVLQPDIIFVSNAKKDVLVPEGARGAPDLCVEVLSKSTKTLDKGKKKELYAKYGVQEYWIVDPMWSTVDVYKFKQNAIDPVLSLDEKQKLTTDLLPGLEIDLAEVFAQ